MHAWHDSTDVLNWCKGDRPFDSTHEGFTTCCQELNIIANTGTALASCRSHACIIHLPGSGTGPCPQPETEMHVFLAIHLLLVCTHFG